MFLLINIVVLALVLLAIVAVLMQRIINSTSYHAKVVPIVVKNDHPRRPRKR